MNQNTILTGLRVNSELTLGNFLGALLPMVRLANSHSDNSHINIFVPDLHSIISDIDGELQQNLIKSLKYYLAAGLIITPNVHFYRQSRVPAHSELCWILNCIANMGELSRMTQFKDKSEGKDSVNVGILTTPYSWQPIYYYMMQNTSQSAKTNSNILSSHVTSPNALIINSVRFSSFPPHPKSRSNLCQLATMTVFAFVISKIPKRR